MSHVLLVHEIVKHFGKVRAVDGVSFEVRHGTITGLLGRNGAGKTTALRMINGIFLPDSGTVEILGASSCAPVRDRIGYLPEERGLYKQMKVLEQLLFLAEIKGRKPKATKAAAEKWLVRFELWDKRDTKLIELSKGNAQKVQLIGALLHDPELVILDEPMSGLDPVNVVLVRQLLSEMKAHGKTVLLSTHMMGEAEKLADDIVLIHDGKVVVSGSLPDIRAAHGKNTVHLDFEGDGAFLSSLEGVERAVVTNSSAEVALGRGVDAQDVLRSVVGRLRIRRFEVASPTLEQIFIESVGAETLAEAAS